MPLTENISFTYANFAFDGSYFYNIDHINNLLIRKDDDGQQLATFPIVSAATSDDLLNEIVALKFTGIDLEVGNIQGNANLWTLENTLNQDGTTAGIVIRRFKLEHGVLRFATRVSPSGQEVPDVYSFTSRGPDSFDTSSFAVEHHMATIKNLNSIGDGFIYLSNVDRLAVGSRVILGPSTNSNNIGKVEEFIVSSVGSYDSGFNGYKVTFRSTIKYLYNISNVAVFHNYIYLFNNNSHGFGSPPVTGLGTVYKLDAVSGALLSTTTGMEFHNVTGAVYSPNDDKIIFTKANQVLYLNPDSFTYSLSYVMDNEYADKIGSIPIYDIALSSVYLYRLQKQQVDWSTSTLYTFSTYNYFKTNLLSAVSSISVRPEVSTLLANDFDKTYIKVKVYDQFGFPSEGQVVSIIATDDNGGTGNFLLFGTGQDASNSVEKQTDENGEVTFYYQSGLSEDVIKLIVTAEINQIKGYSYIYQYKTTVDTGRLYQRKGISANSLIKKLYRKTAAGYIFMHKNFSSPMYGSSFVPGTSQNHYKDMLGGMHEIDWGYWIIDSLSQDDLSNHPTEVAFPALVRQINKEVTAECTLYQAVCPDIASTSVYQLKGGLSNRTSLFKQIGVLSETQTVKQYDFVESFVPKPFSEKIGRNTNIYAKIRDIPGTNIDISTLKMYVNFYDVTSDITYNYSANHFLEITYNSPELFDFGERVNVSIVFYDQAAIPNFIELDYYFDIIEDYKSPVLENFVPLPGEIDVATNTPVSFSIRDDGVGVDISTLVMYVNNFIIESPTISYEYPYYYVTYTPESDFKNLQDVSIYILVADTHRNFVRKSYNFITRPGAAPEILLKKPDLCSYLNDSDTNTIIEIYSAGDGVFLETIRLNIDGEDKRFLVKKLIKRIT